MATETKICRCCHAELPLSEFHKSSATKDGRQNYCHSCMNLYQRVRYRHICLVGGAPLVRLREQKHRYYLNKKKAKQDENKI